MFVNPCRAMLWARSLLMMDTHLTTRMENLCIVHSPSLLIHSLEGRREVSPKYMY